MQKLEQKQKEDNEERVLAAAMAVAAAEREAAGGAHGKPISHPAESAKQAHGSQSGYAASASAAASTRDEHAVLLKRSQNRAEPGTDGQGQVTSTI